MPLRAEQFVGRFQQVDTFNNRVKLIVDQQSEAIAVSIFRLNDLAVTTGELDTQAAAVRSALLRAEQFVGLFPQVDTFNSRVK